MTVRLKVEDSPDGVQTTFVTEGEEDVAVPIKKKPQHVRLELGEHAIFSKVFIDDEEWQATVKRVAIGVEEGLTVCTISFVAAVTVEGPLYLKPWPVIVEGRQIR